MIQNKRTRTVEDLWRDFPELRWFKDYESDDVDGYHSDDPDLENLVVWLWVEEADMKWQIPRIKGGGFESFPSLDDAQAFFSRHHRGVG